MLLGVAIGCAVFGFLAGLFTFKVKQGWCRTCGLTKICPRCSADGAYRWANAGRP